MFKEREEETITS